MTRLLALHYSPWSEKARWALDHHHVEYREDDYVPMLGEPWLRIRLRRWRGRVTVPVLFHSHEIFEDSFAIARHVEAIGAGATLFPGDRLEEIRAWNERSEAVMAAGRPLVVAKTLRSPEALRESLPPVVPSPLRSLSIPVAKLGARFLARKYRLDLAQEDRYETAVALALESLREGLARSSPYLLGKFSYADIAMAVSLQFVRPVDDQYLRLGPATRAAWTQDGLARRFADLLDWRDELYATHRT